MVPTVTADNPHTYREQLERVADFADRIHIDIADGHLAPVKLIDPERVWWPSGVTIDVHIMFEEPQVALEPILALQPNLIIVHAEAKGNFLDMAEQIHEAGVKVGVALLKETPAHTILPALAYIDHVLIFSGDLGHFGGQADLALLNKAQELHRHKKTLEIGWDGGVNANNARRLSAGGIKVLNVGGFIQRARDPKMAYRTMRSLVTV